MTTSLRTLGATIAAFLALGATAWAFLGTTGGGTGSGTASGRPTVVIAAGSTPGATLLPTGTFTGTVTVSLENTSTATAHVGAIVLDTSRGDGGFGTEGITCGVAYARQDNNGAGWDLVPGVNQISLPGAMKMATDAPTTCQGQSIRVFLKTSA